jgi:DNA-binding PadR family transcriptional regulator
MSAPIRLSAVAVVVLRRCEDRPSWLRSLQRVRGAVSELERVGFLERVRPPTGTARNMVAITAAGQDYLDAVRFAEAGRS